MEVVVYSCSVSRGKKKRGWGVGGEKEAVNEQTVASCWICRVQKAHGTMLTSITTVWFVRG